MLGAHKSSASQDKLSLLWSHGPSENLQEGCFAATVRANESNRTAVALEGDFEHKCADGGVNGSVPRIQDKGRQLFLAMRGSSRSPVTSAAPVATKTRETTTAR